MGKTDETRRCKWTNRATKLLVSIWSHDMVQGRMMLSTRNQPVWESIARFMGRKGFNVTSLQCRTRIKNMLCNYYEAVRKKDRSYIEPYFDVFHKIVNSREQKKKAAKSQFKEIASFDVSDYEMEDDPLPLDVQKSTITNTHDVDTVAGNLGVSTEASQAPATASTDTGIAANQENVIVKAIYNQTRALSEAIQVQTESVEKLVVSERERFEAIIRAERKSRKELEEKMDNIISWLESKPARKKISKPLIKTLRSSKIC